MIKTKEEKMRIKKVVGLSLLLTLFLGCSSIQHSKSPAMQCNVKWVILPIDNFTESPHAGQSTEKLTENVLRSVGVKSIESFPAALADSLDEFGATPKKYTKALAWAREQGAIYGVTGSVTEWHYKSGSDGEPAVGIALQIIDIESGHSIWSSAGAKTGWERDALSGTAQKLIRIILNSLSLSC